MTQRLPSVLRIFIPLAVVITLLAGLIYVTAQQVLRIGANDPQIQMAEDAASDLSGGRALPEAPPVDVATSLAPYEIVFDEQGRPVSGSAMLHGALPTVPVGVLLYARDHGENRVTWQPEPGVRSAAVVVPVTGAHPGYVLAGRSLRQVEARTSSVMQLVGAGWLATLAATLLAVIAATVLWPPSP